MTSMAESSFIMTLIPILLGGVVSSLLTLLLGQPVQHYFWRRQRLAERQLATLDEFNKVTAQLLHHCWMDYERATREQRGPYLDRGDPVFLAISTVQVQVRALFSISAREAVELLRDRIIALGESVPDKPWQQAAAPVEQARKSALRALYNDMGIPPRRPGQWLREHVWWWATVLLVGVVVVLLWARYWRTP